MFEGEKVCVCVCVLRVRRESEIIVNTVRRGWCKYRFIIARNREKTLIERDIKKDKRRREKIKREKCVCICV